MVSQPGVNAADYGSRFSAPHLRKRIAGEDENVRSSFTVADVVGEMDTKRLVDVIGKKCGAGLMSVDASSKCLLRKARGELASDRDIVEDLCFRKANANLFLLPAGSFAMIDDMRPRVIQLDFPALPTSSDRATTLAENGTSPNKYLSPSQELR